MPPKLTSVIIDEESELDLAAEARVEAQKIVNDLKIRAELAQ